MRDDFPVAVRDVLAKRVGYRCSKPGCPQATSGPQVDPAKAVNIGVAAHITAASPGGPRYDPLLTSEQRCSAENGIYLCQNHGKLVDNDEARYPASLLREWKRDAERRADLELHNPRQRSDDETASCAKAERLVPDLLRAMRADLTARPLTRDFVVLSKGMVYNTPSEHYTAYYREDHPDLDDKLHVLENLGLIRDVTDTNVPGFRIAESFAEYLELSEPDYVFLKAIGVYFDPANDLHICPRCLSEGKRSFLKDGTSGFSCTVCGQYFSDPSRKPAPLAPYQPRSPWS